MSLNSSLEAMHSALMTKSDSAEVFVVAPDVYGLLWPTEGGGVSYSGTRVYVGNVLVIPGNHRMRIGSIELHCRGEGYDAMSEIYMVQM
jgi:hypothetical protein